MRDFGITNDSPYASAPAVGATGDTYWNTTEKALYQSDGTAWIRTVPLTVQARIERTTTQSIPTGTWTAVIVDTVKTNVGSVWAAGTPDHFTIATAGFYLVGGTVQYMDGAGSGTVRQLAVTGPSLVPVYAAQAVKPNPNLALAVSTGAFLAAGVTIYLLVNQDSGAAVTIGGYNPSVFWIARVA
jgi:hypothetical protein